MSVAAPFDVYNLRLIYNKNTLFTYYFAIPYAQLSSGPRLIQNLLGYQGARFTLGPVEPGSDTIDVEYDKQKDLPDRIFNTAGFEEITVSKLVVVNQKIRRIVSINVKFSSLSVDPPKLYTPAEVLAMINEQNPGLGLGAVIEFEEAPNWVAALKANKDKLTKDQVIFYYYTLREIRVYRDTNMGLLDISRQFETTLRTEAHRTVFESQQFDFSYPSPLGVQVTVESFLRELNFLTGLEGGKTFALQVLLPGPAAGAYLYSPSKLGETPLADILARAQRIEAANPNTPALEFKLEPNVRVDAVRMRALANARVGGQILA